MKHKCKSYYKICRESSGLTQETAAALLDISPRSLAAYENGKTKNPVPEDIVSKMMEIYDSQSLGWWHLKNYSILGNKCLPDIEVPVSNGDMAFQTIMSKELMIEAEKIIKYVLADGVISSNEKSLIEKFRFIIGKVVNKLTSIQNFDCKMKRGDRESECSVTYR